MSKSIVLCVVLLVLLSASLLYGSALAMSSGAPEYTVNIIAAPAAGYELTWSTIGGGGTLAGGSYTAEVAVGQPDAAGLSGGSYALSSGYWGALQNWFNSFFPLIKK